MYFRTIFIVYVLFFGMYASAGTTNFNVNTLVGDDITPPSVPANFTATPVATSQIDLSWGASTDDYLVSGYRIWRDAVQFATTTLLTYSDFGLTSSTTYTYYVVAFDSSNNVSASSTVVSTTTLDTPPPTGTTTSGTTYGSKAHPLGSEIIFLEVLPGQNGALIRFTTKNRIKSFVRWGETTSYEIGSLAEQIFSTSHEIQLTDLVSDTTYVYNLVGNTTAGRSGAMYTGSFTTLPEEDVFPPENVSSLSARIDEHDVLLSWKNPHDSDFTKVRVMRSDRFYPNDIADGRVVYEGVGTDVRDEGVMQAGQRQYYTVFAYDALGNVSSGAIVSVYRESGVTPPSITVDPEKNEIVLTFEHLKFSQEGKIILAQDGSLSLDGAKQLTIALPYDIVPEHLKTILITLHDSTDQVFSFLLRINKDTTAYTGTVAPFGVSGDFQFEISVFDFTTSRIGYAKGTLTSSIQPIEQSSETESFFGNFIRMFLRGNGIIFLWFTFLLIMLAILGRRIMHSRF